MTKQLRRGTAARSAFLAIGRFVVAARLGNGIDGRRVWYQREHRHYRGRVCAGQDESAPFSCCSFSLVIANLGRP